MPLEAGEDSKGRAWSLQAHAKEFAHCLKSYRKLLQGLGRICLKESKSPGALRLAAKTLTR